MAISAILAPSARTLTWTLSSVDPATGMPPINPLVGFLPPGAGASVAFSVIPAPALATGTKISEQASVVFDANPPMSTKVWTTTLDSTLPASEVKPLAAHSCLDFNVNWSGNDVGSGIQDFTIYASDNGGPFVAWLTNYPAPSGTYQGQDGHSYGFYSIARDRVGNLEGDKTKAEASTTVSKTTTCGGPPTLTGSVSVQLRSRTTLTLALQVTNNELKPPILLGSPRSFPRVLSGVGADEPNQPRASRCGWRYRSGRIRERDASLDCAGRSNEFGNNRRR